MEKDVIQNIKYYLFTIHRIYDIICCTKLFENNNGLDYRLK